MYLWPILFLAYQFMIFSQLARPRLNFLRSTTSNSIRSLIRFRHHRQFSKNLRSPITHSSDNSDSISKSNLTRESLILSKLNMTTEKFVTLADDNIIDKPLLDDRTYRLIKIKDNDLSVLLINDPKADKAAASLDVNVGSFADKKYDIPGLAHFCEHLLFMGTEKYPEENEYSSYLSKHSGHSNAYTASEHTNYYFELGSDYLEGALDRFSQFFISPLFSKSCKDREIKAVDSENKKNLQSDLWRFYQLDKLTSNVNHPYNGFSTGNFETLHEAPTKDNVNVRDVLLDFHKNEYSSNIMSLVILGKESLDELTLWAIEKFSQIPNSTLSRPQYNNEVVYDEEHLNKLIKIKPIMDHHKLDIEFMIPNDQRENWESKPSSYYSHLIGHESEGSILHHLKEKAWVNELAVGGHEICQGSAGFLLQFDLTLKGLENWETIVINVFEYLSLILNDEPQFWIWEEVSNMSKVDFKFTQKRGAASTVSKLSGSLYKYIDNSYIPSENIFSSGISKTFDPKKIKEYGRFLNPSNFRILLSSQSLSNLNLTERWYGTEYLYESIPSELIKSLQDVKLNESFHYPIPNKFIPENFKISGIKSDSPLLHPYLIDENNKFHVWFKQDDQFEVPKGIIEVRLTSPIFTKSIENSLYSGLLTNLIEDELTDISYYAALVGLHYKIFSLSSGIIVRVSGYNDKLAVLLEQILIKIKNYKPKPDRFDVIKEKLTQDYKNSGYEGPYIQAGSYFMTLINDGVYSRTEKYDLLKSDKLTNRDLSHFISEIWSEGVFGQIVIHGNYKYEDALRISKLTQSYFDDVAAFVNEEKSLNSQILKQSYVLPKKEKVRYETYLDDPKNINSCISYQLQLDEGPKNQKLKVLTDLLSTIIHEPCFNRLRTKEQLGYIVFSGVRSTRNKIGFRILVQSERTCDYLEYRIEEFLAKFKSQFIDKELTDEVFDKYKQALKNKKLTKLKNLSEENDILKSSIVDGQYDFTQRFKHVQILEDISKEEFIQFYSDYVDPFNQESKSARLLVYLKSQSSPLLNHAKTLANSINNFIYHNDVSIDADKVDSILEKNKTHLKSIIDEIIPEIESVSELGNIEEFKSRFYKDVDNLFVNQIPEGYSQGKLFTDVNSFKATYKLGEAEDPVEPLANFTYKVDDHAHL